MKRQVKEGEIEMIAKPHQIYNTLVAGIANNEALAITESIYGDEIGAAVFKGYAEKQKQMLKDIFGVDYVEN